MYVLYIVHKIKKMKNFDLSKLTTKDIGIKQVSINLNRNYIYIQLTKLRKECFKLKNSWFNKIIKYEKYQEDIKTLNNINELLNEYDRILIDELNLRRS